MRIDRESLCSCLRFIFFSLLIGFTFTIWDVVHDNTSDQMLLSWLLLDWLVKIEWNSKVIYEKWWLHIVDSFHKGWLNQLEAVFFGGAI